MWSILNDNKNKQRAFTGNCDKLLCDIANQQSKELKEIK